MTERTAPAGRVGVVGGGEHRGRVERGQVGGETVLAVQRSVNDPNMIDTSSNKAIQSTASALGTLAER